MPFKTKYQPVLDLIIEMKGEIINSKEENGFFVIEGLLKSEEDIELVKDKAEMVNNDEAADLILKLNLKEDKKKASLLM